MFNSISIPELVALKKEQNLIIDRIILTSLRPEVFVDSPSNWKNSKKDNLKLVRATCSDRELSTELVVQSSTNSHLIASPDRKLGLKICP